MIIDAWFAAWMIIAFSDGRLGGAAVVRLSARRGARLDQEGLSDLARGDLDRRNSQARHGFLYRCAGSWCGVVNADGAEVVDAPKIKRIAKKRNAGQLKSP